MTRSFLFVILLSSINLFSSQPENKCACCAKVGQTVFVLGGKKHVYCNDHAPEIVRVKRITLDNLNEILRKGSRWN